MEKALADDPPILIRDGGYIAPGFNAELDRLRNLKDESRGLIVALQQRYAEEMEINSIKIKHNNILGFFVEVTSLHSDKLMSHPTFIMAPSGGYLKHFGPNATAVEFSNFFNSILK